MVQHPRGGVEPPGAQVAVLFAKSEKRNRKVLGTASYLTHGFLVSVVIAGGGVLSTRNSRGDGSHDGHCGRMGAGRFEGGGKSSG